MTPEEHHHLAFAGKLEAVQELARLTAERKARSRAGWLALIWLLLFAYVTTWLCLKWDTVTAVGWRVFHLVGLACCFGNFTNDLNRWLGRVRW